MANIIMFKVTKMTSDQAYTGQQLKNEVYNIAGDLNIQPSIARMVVNSFPNYDGLIETYDDLGTMDNWKLMIEDMLEVAFRER